MMKKAALEHSTRRLASHIIKSMTIIEAKCKTTQLPRVKLSTDGACIGNPGPGGWASLLRFDDRNCEMFGCHPHTTSNRMELQAAIEPLKALNGQGPHSITVFSDSQYLVRGASVWLPNWKNRRWKTSNGSDVANQDLWEQLDELKARHAIDWQWVRGHANDLDNLRCDSLANRAAMEQISGLKITEV